MNNPLEIDLIINKNKYSKIYNFNFILLIIILIIIYIIFTYKYQTYYLTKGRMINNELEVLIDIKDLKYIKNNNQIIIDNHVYIYNLSRISKELYIGENYDNYCYTYLKINNLTNIDNYIYEIKFPKENKVLVKYLKDYL